jgi:hypothetical protein
MWILKGTLLGTALFFVGNILYLLVMVYASAAKATGTTAIQGGLYRIPFIGSRLL